MTDTVTILLFGKPANEITDAIWAQDDASETPLILGTSGYDSAFRRVDCVLVECLSDETAETIVRGCGDGVNATKLVELGSVPVGTRFRSYKGTVHTYNGRRGGVCYTVDGLAFADFDDVEILNA